MADKTINELTAATTMGNDDLLVLQQGGVAKKLSGKQLGDYVYNAAAEKVAEVNKAVDDARSSINDIVESVQSMTELGTDTTLTTTGMAADAKAAGDKIKAVEAAAMADLPQGTASGSIVTITDGADNIPVKKMTVDIEPVQDLHGYDHPWPAGGGNNLLEITATSQTVSGVTFTVNKDAAGNAISVTANGTATAGIYLRIMEYVAVKAGTYTLYGCPSGGSNNTYSLSSQINSKWQGSDYGTGKTFTLDEDANGTVSSRIEIVVASGVTVSNLVFKPMLVAGSTVPTTFAPYSNICPISGFTGAKITKTRKNLLDPSKIIVNTGVSNLAYSDDGITYTTSTSFVAPYVHIPVKSGENVTVKNTQSTGNSRLEVRMYAAGTPVGSTITLVSGDRYIFPLSQHDTVDSIRIVFSNATTTGTITFTQPFVEYGDQTVFYPFSSIETYDITFPSEAGTVYGGTLEVNEDGSGALTVDKKRSLLNSVTFIYQTTNGRFTSNPISDIKAPNLYSEVGNIICSQYVAADVDALNPSSPRFVNYGIGIGVYKNLFIADTRYTDANQFNSDVGNVAIVYELANPLVYTFTADQVTTLLGTNNVWSDTGDITEFVYRKAPIDSSDVDAKMAAIESMISGRETAMTATKNYTSGSLVIVNDILYRLYANVASGETLTPGTNCRITTVEAEIAERVPIYRFVNGKALSSDITLTAEDIAYDDSLSEHASGSVGEVVSNLKESFTNNVGTQSNNLYDNSKDTDGIVISGSGIETANSAFKTSDYIQTTDDPSIANKISIKSATNYLGTDGATFVAAYGENKNFLVRYDAYANPNGFIAVHTQGMKYIRICSNINATAFMVNIGNTISEYTPFGFKYSDDFIDEVDKLVDEAIEESTTKPYKWSTKDIPNEGYITSDYTGIASYNPTLSELYSLYDALMAAHPNYITKTDLGLDQSGEYHLYKYSFVPEKITVVDTIYTLPNPPKVLLGSGTHGDGEHGDRPEMVVGLYYLFKNICDNWKGNEALTFLRWNVRFDIIPVQNPWGYVNKNRRNSRLVDINRNFPYGWRSGTSGSVDYGGTEALSEAESIIIKNFIESNTDALFYCDIHTTGGNPTQDRMIYFDMIENTPFSVIANDVVIQLSEKWNSEQIQGLTDIDFHGYIFGETPHGAINHWATRYYMPSCIFEGFPNFAGSEITANGDKIMSMCLDEIINVILSGLRYFKFYK